MSRWLRVLLIAAPVIALLFGVPAGVALARHSLPKEALGSGPRVVERPPANDAVRPDERPPFVGPERLVGPPSRVSRAQSGMIGVVTRIEHGRFLVFTRARKRAIVVVDPKATIRMNGKTITTAEIRRGDRVTILGRRDGAGIFHAILIRVVRPVHPDPPAGAAR